MMSSTPHRQPLQVWLILVFLLAIVLMSTLREKLDAEWVPRPFRGTPIAFITGGLMALAFMAFDKALLRNLIG